MVIGSVFMAARIAASTAPPMTALAKRVSMTLPMLEQFAPCPSLTARTLSGRSCSTRSCSLTDRSPPGTRWSFARSATFGPRLCACRARTVDKVTFLA